MKVGTVVGLLDERGQSSNMVVKNTILTSGVTTVTYCCNNQKNSNPVATLCSKFLLDFNLFFQIYLCWLDFPVCAEGACLEAQGTHIIISYLSFLTLNFRM